MVSILWSVTVFPPTTVGTAGMIRFGRLGSSIPLGIGPLAVVFTMTRFGHNIDLIANVRCTFLDSVRRP